MLIDSHCHLDRLKLDPYEGDLSKAIAAAREAGVSQMLCISIDRDNVPVVVSIARQFEGIYASVGIHPLDVDQSPALIDELLAMAKLDEKVVAIGETGLDYYYSKDNVSLQQDSFIAHIEAAKQCRKPLIVHTREAKKDTIALLHQYSDPDVAGVMHCFTEDWEMAKQALDLGFYISISGIVTFKNADQVRDVASKVPLDRLLIETDSPYLAPIPHRGKSNEPRFVRDVANYMAELRGMPFEAIAEQTTANFQRLFNIT
jgi:TatD DNase family protein